MATVVWDTHSAGTMTASIVAQRAAYVSVCRIAEGGATIYWTDDGTTSGTSVFKISGSPVVCPLVELVVATSGSVEYTNSMLSGPILKEAAHASAVRQCMWRTSYDTTGTGFWKTEIFRGGPGDSDDEYTFGLSGGRDVLSCIVYAMGRGA